MIHFSQKLNQFLITRPFSKKRTSSLLDSRRVSRNCGNYFRRNIATCNWTEWLLPPGNWGMINFLSEKVSNLERWNAGKPGTLNIFEKFENSRIWKVGRFENTTLEYLKVDEFKHFVPFQSNNSQISCYPFRFRIVHKTSKKPKNFCHQAMQAQRKCEK